MMITVVEKLYCRVSISWNGYEKTYMKLILSQKTYNDGYIPSSQVGTAEPLRFSSVAKDFCRGKISAGTI